MKKLLRRFKKLSILDKAKFIICSPIIIITKIVDIFVDISAFVYEFVTRRCRQIFVIAPLILITFISILIIIYQDETVPIYKGMTRYEAEIYIYKNCHEMSNNFIVAKDGRVRGFVRADEENIDRILSVIERYDIPNKDKIIECLKEFKNGDYHSAVWLHNHCWTELDGDVGYAVDLKDKYK